MTRLEPDPLVAALLLETDLKRLSFSEPSNLLTKPIFINFLRPGRVFDLTIPSDGCQNTVARHPIPKRTRPQRWPTINILSFIPNALFLGAGITIMSLSFEGFVPEPPRLQLQGKNLKDFKLALTGPRGS